MALTASVDPVAKKNKSGYGVRADPLGLWVPPYSMYYDYVPFLAEVYLGAVDGRITMARSGDGGGVNDDDDGEGGVEGVEEDVPRVMGGNGENLAPVMPDRPTCINAGLEGGPPMSVECGDFSLSPRAVTGEHTALQ